MLVITYTERAAGELRGRIRARLHELGRHDLARSLDGAWISTIHGFCLRLLKAHPFAAGLDPRFRVLDDSQGRVIRGEAFEAALNEFCAGERAGAAAAARDLRRRRPAADADERLRDAALGRPRARARARRAGRPRGAARRAGGRGRARSRTIRTRPTPRASAAAQAPCSRSRRRCRSGCSTWPGCGLAASARRATRRRGRPSSRRRSTSWRCSDRELLQELLHGFAAPVRGGQGPRVGARLRGPAAARPRPAARRRRRCASASSCASARSWSTSSRTRTGSSASSSTC